MDGLTAVAHVRDMKKRYDEARRALHDHRGGGDSYALICKDEDEAWDDYATAKKQVREHIIATYGINIDQLQSLTAG